VFPSADLVGDSFHFLNACCKKMRSMGQSEDVSNLMFTLRVLWVSPSSMDFEVNLADFKTHWQQSPSILTCVWINTYNPVTWVFYGRKSR